MAKRNKRVIQFTTDFATRKKDEKLEVSSSLASKLIHRDKVAKYADEASKEAPKAKAKSKAKAED
ncbi:hypothetical protein N9X40_03230 [bacterium]|nr:hypothetical protein [bacterium]